MKTKPLRWLRRYLPAEAAALLAAVASAQLVSILTDSRAMAAVAGAWGETCVYYAVMLVREVDAAETLWRAVRNLVLEFGVPEALDSLLVRPTLMYVASQLVGDVSEAILIGKIASDVIFYVPVIAAYELRGTVAR
jgi:hypothetical protein